jgi:DNA repair protein RecO (recombination protein O)
MSATKTQAFALKTRDYRDTSLLGDFFTRDYGKIRGIVKGIRDSRGRFGTTFEPFSLNEILFYRRKRGGDLHQVTQGELLDLFPEVRGDLERLAYASYFTELLNELVEVEDPAPAIFDLLHDSLKFLSSGASPRRSARIFEVKVFGLLGLMPEIRACVICAKPSPDPAFFSASLGGIHCKDCGQKPRAESGPAGGGSIFVSKGALNFLDHVRRCAIADLYHVKVSQPVGEEVEKVLRRFTDFHLSRKLQSVIFMEKMGYN